ncbi:hypothetical protein BDC45DRAFT_296762 [Circinella umbellata]|nr:hypothetical protein BDC45DRAFT_296762 [Circinella umbellata]
MKFIQTALLDQRGWLRGQKIEEVFDPVAKSAKGDDSILDCCRYFAQLQKPITLLTNDRNLAIKAMVHDIQSLSSDNRDRLIHFASSLSHYVSTPPLLPSQHHQKQQQQQYSIQNHDNLRVIDEDVDMMDESDDIDVAKQQAQHILEIQQREQESIQATLTNPNSDNHYNVWASRHAPTQRSSSYSKSNNSSRYSNTLDSWNDKPVLDANGEPLIPPSSSAGRVEEMRRKKKGRQQY